MGLKTFIQFSCIFPNIDFHYEDKEYKPEEFFKLHNETFPIYENFDISKKEVSTARLVWSDETKHLYMHVWLKPEEVDYFQKEIITGQLVPMNIKIVADTVEDESIKKYF